MCKCLSKGAKHLCKASLEKFRQKKHFVMLTCVLWKK